MPDSSTPTRVRFAPSPTGYLHVGGARTALFNWLYARKVGGAFLLRIEDTDKARSTEAHTQVILDGLRWLGLDWDEEPIFQGARVARHQEMAEQLKASGHTYEEDGALRLKMPQGEIAWDDLVHGPITFKGEDVRDWIILRSDRTPTYNFAVVVDDIDMRITHVMRGDDHISNTPKQIAVYRALGIATPAFGHVPMIHGMDGKKLSKRHGATAVGDYQNLGILPAAMRNFLALLGWSPGGDRELFYDIKEMIDAFSLDGVQRKSAIFDTKKLEWMNGQHLSHTNIDALVAEIGPALLKADLLPTDPKIRQWVEDVRPRSKTVLELVQQVQDRKALSRFQQGALEYIHGPKLGEQPFLIASGTAANYFTNLPEEEFNEPGIQVSLERLATNAQLTKSQISQSLRIATTGSVVSEPITTVFVHLGKDEVVQRLREAENRLKSPSSLDITRSSNSAEG